MPGTSIMDTTIEASQSGGLPSKPSLPPKPTLAPKPFSLQKNSTIRSFKAPKTVSKIAPIPKSETSQTKKSETKSSPTTTVTTPAKKLPQPISSAETPLKTDPTAEPEASQTEKSETKSSPTTAMTIPTEELSQPIRSPEAAPKTAPTSTSETNKIEKSETKSSPTTAVTIPTGELSQPIRSPEAAPKTAPTSTSETNKIEKSETITPTTTKVTIPTEELSQPISSSETPPKTAPALKSETNQIEQSETENPTAVTVPAKKLPQPILASAPKPQPASALPKSQPEASKTSEALPQVENSLGSETAALDPATETTPTKEEPKSEPAQKDIIQTNHKPPTTAVASPEQEDGEEKQSDTPVSVSQNTEESSSNSPSTNDSFYQRGSVRKRLPKALTSKFESGGVPLPRQPFIPIPKPITKDESNKPESSDSQPVHTTPEPPIKESDTDAEDFTGGTSIQNRISQLMDYVPKPEATTKRKEPEITNGIGDVKEKIKNWASETGPEDQKVEKSPQAADRVCSMGLNLETPRVEVPAAEETPTQPVDSRSTASSSTGSQIEPPEEAPFKDKPLENLTETSAETDKPKEDDVQVQSNHSAAADEKNLAELKKKKMKKRRSVRFGTVVADDGTPPLVLGPEPESSEDENQEENAEVENKEKEEDAVSTPVYKRVGIFQRKDDKTQSQETLKHQEQEEERKRRNLEEQRQKELKDEEERLKLEKDQRQKEEEETRKYQQELMELMRIREKEQELEKEKLRQELEKEQVRKQEEEERKRQEDEERERRELERKIQQDKEEEERKRRELEEQRQKELKEEEERLKLEEEQRQKELKEEEERLKLEEEQRQKEEEESRKYQQRLMELMRMREKEEELEKEKLRQEDEERKRRELERKMQQDKEEEEERKRREEIKLQMEKERADQLKKKMEESQPRTEENDKREEKLINFDAEEPPTSPSSHVSKNTESLIDVVYDDFSIQNPVLDVAFDDFSVKPRRRTFQPRRETAPISSSWRVEPPRKDDLLVSFDSEPQVTQQENEPKPQATLLFPTPAPETPEEEKVKRLLAEFGVKEEGEEEAERPVADQPVERKEEEMENGAQMEDESEEEDNKEPQVNSYITNDEDKLIQTLLHGEQDGISEQASGPDSPTVPDASSEDLDNTDSKREMDLDAVCENSAPLLDNSSQKSKAVLGRRLTRSRPSRSLRLESAEAATVQMSVFKDEKDNQSDSEEEPPESKPVYSSTQRVPMFPGLNPKDLLIGIKKKTGGVAAEAEERSVEDRREQETESQNKKAAPSPSQASGTPRVAPRLAGAKLVLPPALIKDGGHLRPTRRKQTTQQNGET
ncbi:inner centromere protein-like [Poecilia latipinna]|uniref:inner centromere protein-like n=1 Tax=Poecilia latipinna TaxID=48699 RepID=UPI00072E9C91|nr:PREDICTED: inner centromere protein-like [Poecilia latipinna]XP_014905449.1 PREDICTED: inner centromere protein-like [Poecilia latipinna]